MRVTEKLTKFVDDRVDVISEPIDKHLIATITKVADDASRRSGMFEEFLDDESLKGKHHKPMVAPNGIRLTSKYIPYGVKGNNMALLLTVFDADPRIVRADAYRR